MQDGMWKRIFCFMAPLVAILILIRFDKPSMRFIQGLFPGSWGGFFELLSDYGLYLFYATFAMLAIRAFVLKKQLLRSILLRYIAAQVLASFLLVRFGKILFGRARPKYGGQFTFFAMDSAHHSFPSGHATDAFVSGVFLYFLIKTSRYPQCRHLPLFFALLIALSRVMVNAHFPSDVLAGIWLGVSGAALALAWHGRQNGAGGHPDPATGKRPVYFLSFPLYP